MSLYGYFAHKRKGTSSPTKIVDDYFDIKSISDFFAIYENFDLFIKIDHKFWSINRLRCDKACYDENDYLDVLYNHIYVIRGYIKTAKQHFEIKAPNSALDGLAQMINVYMDDLKKISVDDKTCEAQLKFKLIRMSSHLQVIKDDINVIMQPEPRIKASPIYILK